MTVLDYSARIVNPVGSPQTPAFPGGAKTITKSDSDTFSQPVTVYVGTAGTVTAIPEYAGNAGTAVAIKMVAGGIVPFRVWAVKSTGTDAADLVAIY